MTGLGLGLHDLSLQPIGLLIGQVFGVFQLLRKRETLQAGGLVTDRDRKAIPAKAF